jgi:DNA primase
MARFSNELINRIKQDISLVRVVEARGIKLKKQGKDYLGHCPFHNDKTPSFVVSPASNLWNCLGACGCGGSVIDFVMKYEGVSFRHAVELLRDENALLDSSSFTAPGRPAPAALERPCSSAAKPVKQTSVPKLAAPVEENADDQAALQQVVDYYHQTLKQSPDALAFLDKRGLNDPALIDHFKLGYANRTLGLRLPQKNRKAGAVIREQLQRLGVFRDTGREHFNGSLVVPVQNVEGVITELYGRKTLENLRKGTPKHTYLPGPHRGVFNEAGLQNTSEVILCESLIDALTFWRWGFKHVTTSYGVNGFTEDLLQAFIDHKIERVLIAYDRDEAGNKAAEVLAKKLNAQGIECFRVLFPKGMDANEYAQQVTPSQKSLGLVIRKAEWIGSKKEQQAAPEITMIAEPKDTSSLAANAEPNAPQPETTSEEALQPTVPETASVIEQNASPVPKLPTADIEITHGENEVFLILGERSYRVRGLMQNTSHDQLKIQLLVQQADLFYVDKLDLYSSKQRQVFINQASLELGLNSDVIKADLGKVLLSLENELAQARAEEASPNVSKPVEVLPGERDEALVLLKSPDLLHRILSDFDRAGVVGEHSNKLTGYLSCVSRKLDRPLAVMIQSSSAAGKSSLMDAVLALMPQEERVQYSAMTGQSLFYMGETNLKHKILAISEEEGASNASYALKLLQSEGEVTIASTGKDDQSGQLVTQEYRVEGPVMLFLTTTAIDIDEELLNRCLVLTVNESREQTQAIHAAQRSKRTLAGLQAKLDKERILTLHHNAQRLLRPLHIINPYADQLTFLSDKTRTRRDHEKYLTLIDSIALLHQYQREVKTVQSGGETIEYIEVTLEDIEVANELANDVLGRTLDELPPQTRKLLELIQSAVQHECYSQKIKQTDFRFSRKHIRAVTGWSDGQLKIHCKRLEEMEYLLVHRGGRGLSIEYELLYNGDAASDNRQVMGLLDVSNFKKQAYDAQKSGQKAAKSAPSQGQVRPKSGQEKQVKAAPDKASSEKQFDFVENTYQAQKAKTIVPVQQNAPVTSSLVATEN